MDRNQALAELTAKGQPYELEEVELYGRTCRAFKNAPPTLRDLFLESLCDQDFIVFEDERLTFDEAWREVERVGRLLVEDLGVAKGDRVAISARNYPEWILAFMATTSVGAIAVAMNSLWTPEEMAYGLADSGAEVLFADDERLARFAEVAHRFPDLRVIALRTDDLRSIPGAETWASALARIEGGPLPEVEVHPNDDATIFYTSGSTGHPKGVIGGHRGIVSALLSWELDVQARAHMEGRSPATPKEQVVTLLAVPLFHATGSHAVFLSSFRPKRRIVSMRKWDVELALELIERERVNSVVAPAAMTGDLVATAARTKRDLGSLVTVGGGGSARAPKQVRDIDRTFARAVPNTGWGMTETNAIGAGIAGQDYLDHPESSGRCSAVLELRVVDEAGEVLPAGARGELQVRGTSITRGYWNRPEANAETFVDGWLRTGDVAYLDDEGFLYIVDRIKDLVIRGGENIGCGAVEAALLEHPCVVEVSVYGVPDERLGEEVGATIFASGEIDVDELRRFLEPRLAKFEIPRYLRFTDAPLPRTASGKILKRQLRDEAAAAL